MNIFDVVGENFFKPLTSQFKTIYLDCLTIIYESYRSELSYGIEREIVVSKLSDYFERSNISDIEFEDELEILKDSRSKATTFLRKLKDFGWIEYEISNNQTAKVNMKDCAVTLVKTFLEISNPREMEYQSEIAMIYSTLTNEELFDRPYPHVLKPVFERTRALFDGLKKLNTNIKKYIEEITADKTSEEIIRDFFTYHEEIGSKAYHRIKTEENISRFRNTIIGRLRDILNNSDIFERTVKGYQNIENENDYYTAEDEVKNQISAIIDGFRSYDDIVSEIDKKHSKYLKNAVERAKFLLLNTNTTEGKISTILQYMAEQYNREEQNNLNEDASNDICMVFNIFSHGFLSDESLKTVAISRKITDVDDVFEPINVTEEERKMRRIAISEKNKNRFSQKNIEQYVDSMLSSRDMIMASEIPMETKRDLIRVIFISLYGHSSKTDYIVKPRDEIISLKGFRFQNFEIKRGHK
ncbi:MAG: hypothetical protein J6V36_01315 [Clostridia bacterium]|nr:hypothetical protein [Clostridia bacterium]